MKLRAILIIGLISLFQNTYSQELIPKREGRDQAVDEYMKSMDLREKIGQLIIIGVDSDYKFCKNTIKTIQDYKIGGICYFGGNGKDLIRMSKEFEKASKTPLVYAIDGEWGLGMRLKDGYSFPRQLALGAINNDSLIYRMGLNIAEQAKAMGININFAPSVDVNTNPLNPVIGIRSFGEDPGRVARKGWQYTKGMQDGGLITSVKHFPGHGDTEHDSHHHLPSISHNKEEIDSIHVKPFRMAVNNGVWGVMVGHIEAESLVEKTNLPSSLSYNIITKYLKEELGFKGLVFTDALNMQGITKYYKNGRAEVMAVLAGVDVLLMPSNTQKAINAIEKAVKSGEISIDKIDKACRKILEWKYDIGLWERKIENITLPSESIIKEADHISNEIAKEIITFIGEDTNSLPIDLKKGNKVAIIELGTKRADHIKDLIREYDNTTYYYISDLNSNRDVSDMYSSLEKADRIVLSVSSGIYANKKSNYGISRMALKHIDSIQRKYDGVVLMMFTNPYSLSILDDMDNLGAILMCYQNDYFIEKQALATIFDKNLSVGRLPVSSDLKYCMGDGISMIRTPTGYERLMELGLSLDPFLKMDSIINDGIIQKAYPGSQVIVIRNGETIYKRNYGYLRYDSIDRVNDSTIYDIASVSKVVGTTLAIMKLYEDGKIDLDDRISKHLPSLKRTNKRKITIKQALSHNARLRSWAPIWKDYKDEGENFAGDTRYKYEVVNKIIKSNLNRRSGYLYSDFGFILLGEMIEEITKMNMEEYLNKHFYKPMELKNMGYNAWKKGDMSNVAPTENDTVFRKKEILGYVHDQTAFLMGGIAGHAGLFSNAMDVSEIIKMLLNNGEYKGERYLKESTIRTFIARHYENRKNRRGLGFDKPLIKDKSPHCSKYASQESYGHSGFTGTYFWSDPKNKLSIIFLSNRVHPKTSPNMLSKLDIRTNINDLIYEIKEIEKAEETREQ